LSEVRVRITYESVMLAPFVLRFQSYAKPVQGGFVRSALRLHHHRLDHTSFNHLLNGNCPFYTLPYCPENLVPCSGTLKRLGYLTPSAPLFPLRILQHSLRLNPQQWRKLSLISSTPYPTASSAFPVPHNSKSITGAFVCYGSSVR
jgi:hypothetical protein